MERETKMKEADVTETSRKRRKSAGEGRFKGMTYD